MIYFIQGKAGTPVKIGYTSRPSGVAGRVRSLQTGYPWPLVILGTVEGSQMQERGIHELLAPDRLLGEWFDATPRVMRFIELALDQPIEDAFAAFRDLEALFAADVGPEAIVASEESVRFIYGLPFGCITRARKMGEPVPRFIEHQRGRYKPHRYYVLKDVERWLQERGMAHRFSPRHFGELARRVSELPR